MNVIFERALPADAETLVKIQVAAFHYDAVIYPGVEIGGPPGYDSKKVMLNKIQDDETYKIVVDGQIVGGLVLYDMGDEHIHLDVIFIDPTQQNRGIGSQAMAFIERSYPAKKWTLNTPAYAVRNQHFYEKFGFVKVGEAPEAVTGLVLFDYEKRLE